MNSYTTDSLILQNKKKRWIVNLRTYVLFTMFSAPIIDILNGAFGDVFSIGQIVRTIIILVNLLIIFKRIPKKFFFTTVTLFIGVCYLFIHAVITGLNNDSILGDLTFAMKPILFLSQLFLLEICIERQLVKKEDFLKFWKFSCWFIPISLMVPVLLNLSELKSGYYISVNALSMIVTTNVIFCMYFSKEKIVYWVALAVNLFAIVFLGTKSPYLFLIVIFMAIVLFDSKHRIVLLVMGGFVGIIAIYFINNYFTDQLNSLIEYHSYHIAQAIEKNDWYSYLFSGRNNMLLRQWNEIKNSKIGIGNLFFGIGRSNFVAGVEMDFFELVFANGIFVAIFIYSFLVKGLLLKKLEKKDAVYLNLALLCACGFSVLGGHIVLEAIGGVFLAILIATKYSMQVHTSVEN